MLTRVISEGNTALHWAVWAVKDKGNLSAIEALVRMKADVNIRDEFEKSPLDLARDREYQECLAVLLAAGATYSSSPLHDAAAKGQASVIESLVSQGADVDALDESGRTAVRWAVECNQPACIEALVKMKADVNILGWCAYLAADV